MPGTRGTAPDPATVDWEKACRALYYACYRVPVKQHDRTPEQQANVKRFSTRMVQMSEILHGPELGMMDAPLDDACSGSEFLKAPDEPTLTLRYRNQGSN